MKELHSHFDGGKNMNLIDQDEAQELGTCAETKQLHTIVTCRDVHKCSATWERYVQPTISRIFDGPFPRPEHENCVLSAPASSHTIASGATVLRDMTKEGEETKVALGGGATRTKSNLRFDLIPVCTNRRTALRFGLGAVKHGEGNWQRGDWTFVVSCVNHLQTHLNTMILEESNEKDDNVGAMLWNIHAIGWYEVNKPEEFNKAMVYLNRGVKP